MEAPYETADCPLRVIRGHFVRSGPGPPYPRNRMFNSTIGIIAHWPYVLTSTTEFEYGEGHREVVQPDQRVRIYSTGERGGARTFRSHLGRRKGRFKHPE